MAGREPAKNDHDEWEDRLSLIIREAGGMKNKQREQI